MVSPFSMSAFYSVGRWGLRLLACSKGYGSDSIDGSDGKLGFKSKCCGGRGVAQLEIAEFSRPCRKIGGLRVSNACSMHHTS